MTDDASETSTAAAEEQPESITPEAVTLESAAQAKDEPLSEGTDKLPSEGLDWLSGKQVVRALLVVGLTAVALYLLKRRFF